ncbi:MAG: TonB-dependent receptor [Limnobacter sp.]|nr:TonB-dependent receptor [Limnobacter sp.]
MELFSSLGQIGLQREDSTLKAVGEEAFLPSSNTESTGLFYLGQRQFSLLQLSYGLRLDETEVRAASSGLNPVGGPIDAEAGLPGPGLQRSFSAQSASLAAGWQHNAWNFGSTFSVSERAPAAAELFADGVHVATAAYEKGNPNLEVEKSTHLDITAAWSGGKSKFSATAFTSEYDNYIGLLQLQGANSTTLVDGETVDVYQFSAIPARFQGLELAGSVQTKLGSWKWQPGFQMDLVRGKREDTGTNLPRQTPIRLTLNSVLTQGNWMLKPEVQYVSSSKPGEGETRTASYTLLNLKAEREFAFGQTGGVLFIQLKNLTDRLAYSANTIETVRFFTPLPGKSATLGLKLYF